MSGSTAPATRTAIEALDIPVGARILTIADAYEAMTSSRPYRKVALTHEVAIAELEKFAGIQFDPDIVPILVGLDRETLDRPPERPDELPTMLHRPDPRDEAPSESDGLRRLPPRCPRRHPGTNQADEARSWPLTMFLSVIALALVVGALAGGGLPRLADLRLRWVAILGIALALRVATVLLGQSDAGAGLPLGAGVRRRLPAAVRVPGRQLAGAGAAGGGGGHRPQHAGVMLNGGPDAHLGRRLRGRRLHARCAGRRPVPLPDLVRQRGRVRAPRRHLRRRGAAPDPASSGTWSASATSCWPWASSGRSSTP